MIPGAFIEKPGAALAPHARETVTSFVSKSMVERELGWRATKTFDAGIEKNRAVVSLPSDVVAVHTRSRSRNSEEEQ